MFWIVSYDIPNDRRRTKVAKILEGFGRRAQFSVFECEIDSQKCAQLEARLKAIIDASEDDIRFYPMNRADLNRVRLLGRAHLQRKQSYYIVERSHLADDDDLPF